MRGRTGARGAVRVGHVGRRRPSWKPSPHELTEIITEPSTAGCRTDRGSSPQACSRTAHPPELPDPFASGGLDPAVNVILPRAYPRVSTYAMIQHHGNPPTPRRDPGLRDHPSLNCILWSAGTHPPSLGARPANERPVRRSRDFPYVHS